MPRLEDESYLSEVEGDVLPGLPGSNANIKLPLGVDEKRMDPAPNRVKVAVYVGNVTRGGQE